MYEKLQTFLCRDIRTDLATRRDATQHVDKLDSWQGKQIHLLSTASIPPLGPVHLHFKLVLESSKG
jgi:hypothetical protein